MKKIVALFLLSLTPLATPAVDDGQVMYVGGTVAALKEGVSGKLDATSPKVLSFDYSGGKLIIPFEMIDSFEYSRQVARHLGILPAIAVGLVKHRQSRHFFRISYHDESKAPQVAIFEVIKEMPHVLRDILQARAHEESGLHSYAKCGVQLN